MLAQILKAAGYAILAALCQLGAYKAGEKMKETTSGQQDDSQNTK